MSFEEGLVHLKMSSVLTLKLSNPHGGEVERDHAHSEACEDAEYRERAIVTVDAMGCRKSIARTIPDSDAEYLMRLKGNQRRTPDAVKYIFE